MGEPFTAEDFESAIDDVFEQLLQEFGGLVELDREEGWQLYPQAPRAAGVSCLRWGSSIVYQVMTDRSNRGVWELDADDPDSLDFIRDATRAVSSGGVDGWVRLGKSRVVVTMPNGDQETTRRRVSGRYFPMHGGGDWHATPATSRGVESSHPLLAAAYGVGRTGRPVTLARVSARAPLDGRRMATASNLT